jgi:hypothetical protein
VLQVETQDSQIPGKKLSENFWSEVEIRKILPSKHEFPNVTHICKIFSHISVKITKNVGTKFVQTKLNERLKLQIFVITIICK